MNLKSLVLLIISLLYLIECQGGIELRHSDEIALRCNRFCQLLTLLRSPGPHSKGILTVGKRSLRQFSSKESRFLALDAFEDYKKNFVHPEEKFFS